MRKTRDTTYRQRDARLEQQELDYREYLSSEAFDKGVRQIKLKFNFCECCLETGSNFDIHHIHYRRVGNPKTEIKSVLRLCRGCHSKIHELEKSRNISTEKATRRVLGEVMWFLAYRSLHRKGRNAVRTAKRLLGVKGKRLVMRYRKGYTGFIRKS